MTLSISKSISFVVFLTLFFFVPLSRAEFCKPDVNNEYEKIFCELKRRGLGDALPSLYDFQKNPPLTQAYLLKKPAERAGIPLRIPRRENNETVSRQEALLEESEAVRESVVYEPVPVLILEPADYSQCVLRGIELHCAQGVFELVTNQINQHLRDGVLSDQHHLALPVFQGDATDTAVVESYLREAYQRYLEGMMEIGLGASTVSYSKFYKLYGHIQSQRLDFVGRFETMYGFLKQDKASIGVNTQPVIAAGFMTRYCSEMDKGLLACEYQRDNYLFRRVGLRN